MILEVYLLTLSIILLYTYTTHNDIMSGEFGEWSSSTMSVAILGAMLQALANLEKLEANR